MDSRPKVHTEDYNAIPKRWWENPVAIISTMATAYRYEVCTRCETPVREHVWFVANVYTNYVFDCSVQPLDGSQP